jgi:hypothetical protein
MSSKPLPVSLQKLVRENPDKLMEGHTEQDSFVRDGSWSHWIYFKPGWINTYTETHCIHEPTVKDCLQHFKGIKRCECESCLIEMKQS